MYIKFLIALCVAIILFILPRTLIWLYASSRIINSSEILPKHDQAIVFGAGLRRDSKPTTVLRDRITTAVQLYQQGKIQMVLMSGDSTHLGYNEPLAMRDYAIELGLPENIISMDSDGRSTYDTCFRAIHVFSISQAILITQQFHLPRAIYTCNLLGLKSIGFPSDIRSYNRLSLLYWYLREFPATWRAILDIFLIHPQPIYNESENFSKRNS